MQFHASNLNFSLRKDDVLTTSDIPIYYFFEVITHEHIAWPPVNA